MTSQTTDNDFLDANRANWDERVESHLVAYDASSFAQNPHEITSVVVDDLALLEGSLPGGSVVGLRMMHLQCHIGLDTLSWARLGATVTGVDFSSASVDAARMLADASSIPARFIESSIDDVAEVVTEKFDVVYTSIGVLPWLPRLDTWAQAIFGLLEPGGVFFVRDAHPMVYAIDYDRTDELVVTQPYFETGDAIRYDEGTTYADDAVRLENSTTYEWPHSLSEIIQSLLDAGLQLESFREHTTIPWAALPSLVKDADAARYRLLNAPERLPLTFSLIARRPRA
jgi:2-polyprenyl-3-methyl-5-hydroxy-6-metoxy-1,4-benzoquinol methylase